MSGEAFDPSEVPGPAAVRVHDLPSAEVTVDRRRSGITPSPVIYGTGCGFRQLAALVDTLSRAAQPDNDEKDPPK